MGADPKGERMAGSEPVSAKHMSREGESIKKPEAGDHAAEVMEANRMVQEERRNAERRVVAERDRARQEIERVRAETDRKLGDMTAERRVLLRTIAQLQTENEAYERQVVLIQAKLEAIEWVRQGLVPQAPAPASSSHMIDVTPGSLPVSPMPADGRIPAAPGTIFRVSASPQQPGDGRSPQK